jgi:hypothetical protein
MFFYTSEVIKPLLYMGIIFIKSISVNNITMKKLENFAIPRLNYELSIIN